GPLERLPAGADALDVNPAPADAGLEAQAPPGLVVRDPDGLGERGRERCPLTRQLVEQSLDGLPGGVNGLGLRAHFDRQRSLPLDANGTGRTLARAPGPL